MRWIDFKNRQPTDTNLEGWKSWTKGEWATWLEESERLHNEAATLDAEARQLEAQGKTKLATDKIAERNKLIDDNSDHWGKLKPWLLALSHGKCWFTEAQDKAAHFDVEHYRPKKEAKDLDGTKHDGYWWLAFEYSNYRIAGNVPNRKKGGWFPLHPDSRRSKFGAQCEESETPHLLDPIEKTDVDLLAFDEEGNAIPVPGTKEPWILERVNVSIERLKLNEHDALPEARRQVWQKMSKAITGFIEAKSAYKPGINPTPKATMEEKAKQIWEMTRPNAELSSVALWCLRFRNDPDLLRLAS